MRLTDDYLDAIESGEATGLPEDWFDDVFSDLREARRENERLRAALEKIIAFAGTPYGATCAEIASGALKSPAPIKS